MPVVIKLTFPAGRYHATPWGRHVNEGAAEWPPSPWRLLRALIAVWKRTRPTLPEKQMKRILTPLVEAPVFHLPPHRLAHTRHALPMNVVLRNYKASSEEKKSGRLKGDPSIVLDAFVCVDRHKPLFIGWPDGELSPADRAELARLLANLSSLGRAEAWVDAELSSEIPDWNCMPAAQTDPNPIPVLCPDPATAFGSDHYPVPPWQDSSPRPVLVADFLLDCPPWHLCLDTKTMHDAKWPTMPGARWVNFVSPVEAGRIASHGTLVHASKPNVIRFLLDGPVLPLLTDTVRVAEAFRAAAMARFERWCAKQAPSSVACYRRENDPERFWSPILAGKDALGQCRSGHEHAYYLPTAETAEPCRLTHLTVCAREGLGKGEIAALAGFRRLRVGDLELDVQMVGLGQTSDFRQICAAADGAKVWVSATPYVGPSHIGLRGRDRYLRKALRREVRRWVELHLPEPKRPSSFAVEELSEADSAWVGRPRPIEFCTSRSYGKTSDFSRQSGVFRVTLSSPIRGPLCLGYASHFGLGLFLPITGEANTQ